MLGDATFREGFAVLARMGHSFDAWLYHPQIDELASLADAFPDAKIVLNHCGGVVGINAYRKDEVFPVWKKSIDALAKRPNVYVKLGGLGMRLCGHAFDKLADPPSSQMLADAWRPYIETCIAAFGRQARDVREQLPGRQGLVQLSGVLERLQDSGEGREREREGGSVRRQREAVLSARRDWLSGSRQLNLPTD